MNGSAACARLAGQGQHHRNTPCVLGCWGPMLMVISTVSRLCSSTAGALTGANASIDRSPTSVAMALSLYSSSGKP